MAEQRNASEDRTPRGEMRGGNDNESLWRDHNSLRLLCERDSDGLPVSYFKYCEKRVCASISA